MKPNLPVILAILTMAIAPRLSAQADSTAIRDEAVREFQRFFEAFHARDTAVLRKFGAPETPMHTVSTNAEGQVRFTTGTYGSFLISISSIPETMTFEERILEVKTRVDGLMVHIWAPYEFYRNGQFSHRGVNSVHWFREDGKWTIAHFIDTRQR